MLTVALLFSWVVLYLRVVDLLDSELATTGYARLAVGVMASTVLLLFAAHVHAAAFL